MSLSTVLEIKADFKVGAVEHQVALHRRAALAPELVAFWTSR